MASGATTDRPELPKDLAAAGADLFDLWQSSGGAQAAHPARHNKNLSPLIQGPIVQVTAVHAKVRRDGYRKPAVELDGAGSTTGHADPFGPDDHREEE